MAGNKQVTPNTSQSDQSSAQPSGPAAMGMPLTVANQVDRHGEELIIETTPGSFPSRNVASRVNVSIPIETTQESEEIADTINSLTLFPRSGFRNAISEREIKMEVNNIPHHVPIQITDSRSIHSKLAATNVEADVVLKKPGEIHKYKDYKKYRYCSSVTHQ